MKKQSLYVFLVLMFCNVSIAETWTCENFRHGKVIYEVKDTKIILKFPNNDGRNFIITKDKREFNLFVYGEGSDKLIDFDYDIYMDYRGKYVINRTQDTLSGYSHRHTDKNCVIFK
tara:strand:- start:579 stop:926 length:348 start_codon:yes stop_codon:yes gene_type:complete